MGAGATTRPALGEWFDPRRGRIALSALYPEWSQARSALKRKTREADESAWRNHIQPRFGDAPLTSITRAQVSHWVGGLVEGGCSTSTANRYLSTLRSMLAFAVADGRLVRNVATGSPLPRGGTTRREGQFLTLDELHGLTGAATGRYADLVTVLGLCGLRWGELAGLRVGDLVAIPGPGLRVQRGRAREQPRREPLRGLAQRPPGAHRAASGPGARDRGSMGSGERATGDWLFPAPKGGPAQ